MKVLTKQQLKSAVIITAMQLACTGSIAQSYTYFYEGFEESAWATKGTSVTSSTGKWVTNKNIQSNAEKQSGEYSLLFSSKNGIISPELPEGAGTLIYYAFNQNRQVNVDISTDNVVWTNVESYKESNTAWMKHSVAINNKDAKYVRISTTSNGNFYIDNLIITKTDGTDGNGKQIVTNLNIPYFTQTFETTSQYPQSKEQSATETSFTVEEQGEWKYLKAYKGSNEAYIKDGSAYCLRMLKGGAYVISPILTQGAVKVGFNEGRTGKELQVYASADEGLSWTLVKNVETDGYNEIYINDKNVNRIKISNESSSGDCDIDNITIYAYPQGTPPSVTTAGTTNIGSSHATVGGTVTDNGDKGIKQQGVCWSYSDTPTLMDNIAEAKESTFTVDIKGLKASTTVYYRAFALSLAGVGYGDIKSFATTTATTPSLKTKDTAINEDATDETNIYINTGGTIDDNGGADITEVGVCYSTQPNPSIADNTKKGYLRNNSFNVLLPLSPSTTYHLRAYATNAAGTSYGETKTFTTPEISIPDYAHNIYYVSPDGNDDTADGTAQKPFYSLHKLMNKVVPGDTIFMMAGTYKYSKRIDVCTIGKKNSGTIALFAKDGRAVLDFSAMPLGDNNQGMRISASYWHVYGLDILGCGDNGMLIECNKPSGGGYNEVKDSTHQAHDNLIENCRFYRNRDTGLQIKNLGRNNKIVNCDAFFNADPDHGDADGFAVKISHGDGNYFYGCRAWNNSDDGWDGFIKTDGNFPDDITTSFDCCWAFNNGFLEDGSESNGNGNGFKLGSDFGRNNVIMNRCLAFNNLAKGFDQNHNTGSMILNNCTGYSEKYTKNKSHYTYRLDEAVATGHEIRLTNCVAISDGIADRNESAYAPHSVKGTLITCDLNTLPSDYKSISPQGTDADRQADGTLPATDFMHIAYGNTKLIDKGSPVTPYTGESRWSQGITFTGAAPDLGCFETDIASNIRHIYSTESSGKRLSVKQTAGGLVMVSVENGGTATRNIAIYDINGMQLASQQFCGCTASLFLHGHQKALIIKVEGPDINESVKISLR